MILEKLKRSGVRSVESLIEIVVINLEIINYMSLVVVVSELNLPSKVGVVDEDQMSMRTSFSEIGCLVSEQDFYFSLQIYRRECIS